MVKLIKNETDLSILNKEVTVSMTVEEIIYITCILGRSNTNQIVDTLKSSKTEYNEQIYKLVETMIDKCTGDYTLDSFIGYRNLMFDSLK